MKIDDQEAIRLYSELRNQYRVAERMGVSQAAVSSALRRNGIHIGLGGNQKRPGDDRVLELWEKYHNQHTIARELDVSQASVSAILRKHGIHAGRGRRNPIHELPMDEVAQRYHAGESTHDLGSAYGVDPEVIRRRMRKHGIERRSLIESRPRGQKNNQYKHGRGYNPMHLYRRQSYEVAAICLGQPVPRGWVIHHLDENPENNQPDNLILFPSQSLHANYHQRLLKLQRANQPIDATQLALEIGGQQLPQPPAPIEL